VGGMSDQQPGRPGRGPGGDGPNPGEVPPSPAREPRGMIPGSESRATNSGGGGWFNRFLAVIEWLGNLLPHPVTLFALFAFGVVMLSGVAGFFEWQVADPRPAGAPGRAEDGIIRAVSLMSGDGFRWMVENLVSNFVGFVPLGTVLVALLGVGVAERSGLLSAAIRLVVLGAPKTLVTAALVFAGVVSNTASEMGYVVIVPLGAAIFYSLGRHPFAGLAAAFAGVSGGYSANILIGTVDPLLAGITEEAARMFDPTYEVHPAVNWYFMIVSTFLITIIGTFVTSRIVEPKLGRFDDSRAEEGVENIITIEPLSRAEKRGLKWAGVAALCMAMLFVFFAGPHFNTEIEVRTETVRATADDPPGTRMLTKAMLWSQEELDAEVAETQRLEREIEAQIVRARELGMPEPPRLPTVKLHVPVKDGWRRSVNEALFRTGWGVLRNPDTGALLRSPFTSGVVAMIFMFFIVPGFVFGSIMGTMKSDRDIINAMAAAMSSMGLYIVLVFFAAQFVAYFGYTNFGSILAVVGSDAIRAMNLDNPLVFIPFILMCCFVNLMLGSASAQWAVTAPIFVPMLMQVGYSPEVIQAAYRIGDSTTNIITPMMSYFGIIFAFAARYDRKLGIGTLISMMLPYTILFLVGWVGLFYLWVFAFGLPVGPGAPTYFP
jgi:p-aminobenzoyl-glutamate transporter AbgT